MVYSSLWLISSVHSIANDGSYVMDENEVGDLTVKIICDNTALCKFSARGNVEHRFRGRFVRDR